MCENGRPLIAKKKKKTTSHNFWDGINFLNGSRMLKTSFLKGLPG